MTAATSGPHAGSRPSPDESIRRGLGRVEELLEAGLERDAEAARFAALADEFKQLHAHIRAHHAADYLRTNAAPGAVIPSELTQEWDRLRGEHPRILGQLDWLIRHVDAIADQSVEDKDVFILRVRELIAVLRRHDAEEDRLFAIAVWHDTGGES